MGLENLRRTHWHDSPQECHECQLADEVERLKAENKQLKERLEDVYLKDTGKTREINILTKENNQLREALEKTLHLLKRSSYREALVMVGDAIEKEALKKGV